MRVLLLVANLAKGGAERAILRYATVLGTAGHLVKVVLLENRVEIPVPAGVSIEALGPAGKRTGWLAKRVHAYRLSRWCNSTREKFHLAISTLPFMDEIAIKARVPRLVPRIANTLGAEIDQLAADKRERRLRRYRTLYAGRTAITVSQGVADDLVGRIGADRTHVRVVYNPFDFDELARLAAEPVSDLPESPFIVHAGRYMQQKRHDVLLDAFKIADLPHKLVLLCDAGPELRRDISVRGLSDRVVLAGFRSNPYPWMGAADALVLSSDREGMPNVLVEALACGTPAVSTNCPSGPREVLTGTLARYLSPPGDPAALAANLKHAVESPQPVGPQLLDRFGPDRFLKAIEAIAGEVS